MATLVLGAVGGMFGPVGGALGTFLGRSIDSQIFGSGNSEGPRLKELAVSGSSYGTPIPKHFGTMRSSGTIIWSTDLKENKQKEGGGKGQPGITTYSYSVSFAVALASRPIDRLGRIWADGNLLRGTGGDLKANGRLRIYSGLKNQRRDPLMMVELGDECPAFRGSAYVVFEDLDLTDFGNRIPALSFEIFSGEGHRIVGDLLDDLSPKAVSQASFPELTGFSYEGGRVSGTLSLVDRLAPFNPKLDAGNLVIEGAWPESGEVPTLPPAASWDEGDFGKMTGSSKARADARAGGITALRYYDVARDYQVGLQRALGYETDQRVFEFPGALRAGDARGLARKAQQRASLTLETLSWRCAELDPAISPGTLVRVPGELGLWRTMAWEWRERGIELELVRYRAPAQTPVIAAPGVSKSAPDRLPAATTLQAFELPWDGIGNANERRIFTAVASSEGRWAGAGLYAVQNGSLITTGQALTRTAITGTLVDPLSPSNSLRLETHATLHIRLQDKGALLEPTDTEGLAQGRNRLRIGSEILQFLNAVPKGDEMWELSGLLRGRGGTEAAASVLHEPGTAVVFLDEDVTRMTDEAAALATQEGYAAFGPTDSEPSFATVADWNASLAPPSPVHATFRRRSDGHVELRWARRVRGGWQWQDGVDQPLVEETELYEIGQGPIEAPTFLRRSSKPFAEFASSEIENDSSIWVRQIGTYAPSTPQQFRVIEPRTEQ